MKKIEIENLILTSKCIQGTTIIAWEGTVRERDPYKKLIPALDSLLEEEDDNGDLKIIFNKLEYINSTSILAIIDFLKKTDQRTITTIVEYDPAVSWQKTIFPVLGKFSKILKKLTVVETSGQSNAIS